MSKDDDNNKNNGKKDYEVGYGKPPKNRQFGAKDGNPRSTKGRPPGRNIQEFDRLSEEAFWHSFNESGQKAVPIREDGEELVIPLIMALAKSMAKDALSGDKHARKEYLRYLEKSVKGKDKLVAEMDSMFNSYHERKLSIIQKPGSLECFHFYYEWFMMKKHLRALDGEDRWPYENGEPYTDEDWAVFLNQYEHLKANPTEIVSWPLKYAADLEEERIDNMTREEILREDYEMFKHRKEMRAKEGEIKWPYMVEEPVDEEDWQQYEKHVQDRLDGKENPTPWPPAYWYDDVE